MSPNIIAPADWTPGVDASYDELTPPKAAALRAAGVAVWWQDLWTGGERPQHAVSNLTVARDAGMIIAAYGCVTSHNPGWWNAEKTREGVPDDLWAQLVVVPCDVELPGIPNASIRDFVERLATYGKRRAVYTSWNAWVHNQGDAIDFTDCLLCNAAWDGNPDVDFAALPFGGWTVDHVLLEQYTGGEEVEGVFVDSDVWNARLLAALESEDPMPEVTKGEFGQLFALVLRESAVITALASAVADMARHVYTEDEPLIAQLRARLDELTTEHAKATSSLPPPDTS